MDDKTVLIFFMGIVSLQYIVKILKSLINKDTDDKNYKLNK